MTPIEHFEAQLCKQVPPQSVSLARCRPFPPPLGAWLTKWTPRHLRVAMRASGVTPAGLLAWWLIQYPCRLQVAGWSKAEISKRYATWTQPIKEIYVRDRASFVALFEVDGKLSEATRLTAARYGAWRAMSALEADSMRLDELEWAGLAIRMNDHTRTDYWLVSDNLTVLPEGTGPVYTASVVAKVLAAGVGGCEVLSDVMTIFPNARLESIRPAKAA